MPQLIRVYIRHVAIGFAVSAVMVAALLAFNVANLWHLVSTSDVGVMAVGLLWLFNGLVFAGVQFGIAIMGMAEDDDDEPRGGTRARVMLAEPVPVRVTPANPRELRR
ncbi:MAG: hypothetical protein GC146_02765 [Limimaricola sp.]|uniref:hypothetical protein n=1 Tax=Limimaricola sp. TaxID=2211665 RepID=UPI001D39A1D8|nr:hypothetical protein [Limimaricola sp.]MBI1416122.1 hypothetical protein [Limimaricola sp.]